MLGQLLNTVNPLSRRANDYRFGAAFAAFLLILCGTYLQPAHAENAPAKFTAAPKTEATEATGNALEYVAYDPAPSGALRVTRPAFVWRIVPAGDSRVTAVSLKINNQAVPAVYDAAQGAVIYLPQNSFAPGSYTAKCEVTVDEVWVIDRKWEFSISRNAAESLPAPDARQQKALGVVNALRSTIGLPALRLDNRLCAAASGHCAYLRKNNRVAHTQQKSDKDFIGTDVGARVAAFGYTSGCFETISEGSDSLSSSVNGLFDAPYHRAAFLQPVGGDFGAGVDGDLVTLIFGACETESVATYPVNGQKNIPCAWDGNEAPNPLRLHGGAPASGKVGYPISLFHLSPELSHLKIQKAALVTTADNTPVPVFVNTPDNDDFLPNGVLLIPRKPLKPGTAYKVTISGQTDSGFDISRTWTFTTAAAPANAAIAANR